MTGKFGDGGMIGDQLQIELDPEQLLELKDEMRRVRGVEAETGQLDVGRDRRRRQLERLGEIGRTPIADLGFARIRG